MEVDLISVSERASMDSPVPIIVRHNPRMGWEHYLINVIKVNLKEKTVVGYTEGAIMDVLDPAKVKKQAPVRTEYFMGDPLLAERKTLVLHSAVVDTASSSDDFSFIFPPLDKFIKVGWDMITSYGDGGGADLIYLYFSVGVCQCQILLRPH